MYTGPPARLPRGLKWRCLHPRYSWTSLPTSELGSWGSGSQDPSVQELLCADLGWLGCGRPQGLHSAWGQLLAEGGKCVRETRAPR